MKIVVEGHIIETEHIYDITPVCIVDVSFKIISLNNNVLVVEPFKYYGAFENCDIMDKSIEELNNFRQIIIDIWLENQSDLPKFNFKK